MQTPWLDYLIKLQNQGFKEIPGPESNPKIIAWAHGPGHYPDMTDDSTTPWCGIGMAGVFSDVGMANKISAAPAAAIRWMRCGVPCKPMVGAIAIFPRPGGNHVTCIRAIKGTVWECIGCNQNDSVTTSTFQASQCKGTRWPMAEDVIIAAPSQPTQEEIRYSELLKQMQVLPEWQPII